MEEEGGEERIMEMEERGGREGRDKRGKKNESDEVCPIILFLVLFPRLQQSQLCFMLVCSS